MGDAGGRPNIILIITDQQRYDTIGALGYPWMITPNLDRLAAGGAVLTDCFCAAPSCVPSRYSLFNGLYPSRGRVYNNGCAWGDSWVSLLRGAGYVTANVGKMHTVPYAAECGFDHRLIVENKDRPDLRAHSRFFDEWDRHLYNLGADKPSRWSYKDGYGGYADALGAYEWPMDGRLHPDEFTGDLALWFIERIYGDAGLGGRGGGADGDLSARGLDRPLFLEIGFPGPHPPYDPPQGYIDMYGGTAFSAPEVTEAEKAGQPPPQQAYRREMLAGNHDAIGWKESPTAGELERLRRYYAANVTLIDHKVGQILAALGGKGLLDDAVVIFTSDHGDCLGDHGHIQKWTMYDEILRVPTIVNAKGRIKAGTVHSGLAQQMDVADYIMRAAGVAIPEVWDAEDLGLAYERVGTDGEACVGGAGGCAPDGVGTGDGRTGGGRRFVVAEHSRDNVWHGADFMEMVRTRGAKLVRYPGEAYGELYDLAADPGERVNRWADPAYAALRSELTETLLDFRTGQVR
ncbi:MAG: sulfatase-like hydrolase/transferase [Oscillospiraceae bacterium]|nr:sulfatase-like hydrolase/transferase [Oscillospiraceae bacterium]